MTDVVTPARCVVADPPWRFRDALPGRARGASRHYATLTAAEICRLVLPPIADDAYLLLWRVSAMQAEALRVARAWGFDVKSELVWCKRTPAGKRHFGLGRHVRLEHEVCLIATRGRVTPLRRDIRSTFEAPVGTHSEKPDAFYALVEQLCHGPYLELFARRQRPGWTCIGDELGTRLEAATPVGVTPVDAKRSSMEGSPRSDGLVTSKPCAVRFAPGRWCTRSDGHDGEHDGPPATVHAAPSFLPPRRVDR